MKYVRIEKEDGKSSVLTHDQAKELLKRNYAENVCTYDDMLSEANVYPCMFCDLVVEAE